MKNRLAVINESTMNMELVENVFRKYIGKTIKVEIKIREFRVTFELYITIEEVEMLKFGLWIKGKKGIPKELRQIYEQMKIPLEDIAILLNKDYVGIDDHIYKSSVSTKEYVIEITED